MLRFDNVVRRTASQVGEEEDEELQEEACHDDEVDCRVVDRAVDLGRVVRKINVVAVHHVLQDQVNQTYKTSTSQTWHASKKKRQQRSWRRTEGSDERTGDAVNHRDRKHAKHPRIVASVLVRPDHFLRVLRQLQTFIQVHEQCTCKIYELVTFQPTFLTLMRSAADRAQPMRMAYMSSSGSRTSCAAVPNKRRRDDIVDEKRAVVGQEDAAEREEIPGFNTLETKQRWRLRDSLPAELVLVVVLVREPHEEAHGAGEAERGQHEDHEDEEVERLLHDRQVLRRSETKHN